MNKLGSVSVGNSSPVRIMGILNTSPESFYKKTIAPTKRKIIDLVKRMEEEGADFIDVGGMSTAPYLKTMLSENIEIKRVNQAIKIIQQVSNLPISVDTCRSGVAQNALDLGVEIINDISGLKYDDKMIGIIEKYRPSLVLCAYSQTPIHGNQLNKTRELLQQSINLAKSVNISLKKIVLDPAIGFFRQKGNGPLFTRITEDWIQRDLLILQNLRSMHLNQPVLVSVSNKSFIGKLLKIENPEDRLFGSIAAEVFSVINGANIIRTHNVKQTKEAITVTQKLLQKIRKGL